MTPLLADVDPEVARAIDDEVARQSENVNLIASENLVSEAVLEAMGSVFTNKYAEGYPGKRYYGGCANTDTVEALAIERAKLLFSAEHANVQPHSGAQANMAVYFSVLKPGDTLLGMSLPHGGHLTHGHPLNFSGAYFKIVPYGVERQTELLNYSEMEELARAHRPKLIVVGASAYSRVIDFPRVRRIADACGAMVMADVAHYAGLIAAGEYPNPVPYVEFVTLTTHKTLRGPRGGLILCQGRFARDVDRALFPGIQGGPLVHMIAAKAVALREAFSESFRRDQAATRRNARRLAATLERRGYRIISGGTDTHMFLMDVFQKGMTGQQAETILGEVGIAVNKNVIPFDANPPLKASGLRIGTPSVTTRGMSEPEMDEIGSLLADVLESQGRKDILDRARVGIANLCHRFPFYQSLRRRATRSSTPETRG
ncbi:MAG TPA: serine hydroxymethyltransferase [Candidatus Polarisedimenticolia bacterium]|nr:serine hydroxymethyltransferase [Candidatus Polarisedimenticolia bacterium]